MMTDGIKYGAAFFEDTTLPRIATIARAGDSTAERVAGTEDLSSDTVWLTNLESSTMWSRRLNKNARLRDSKFLRVDVNQILKTIGMQDEPDDRKVRAIADIFGRVMQIMNKVLQINYVPQKPLRNGIRKHLAPPNPAYDKKLLLALKDATKFFTNCQSTTTQEVETKTFYLNPIEHARKILSSPVPAGEWTLSKNMPSQGTIGDWIEDTGPILARVTINHIEPSLSALLNYGSDLSTSEKNRQWLTANELLYLISMASEITLHEAYIPDGCVTYEKLINNVFKRFDFDCNVLSISWGLFLDNLWVATGMPLVDRSRGIKSETTNPVNPFLRAYDRALCMQTAIGLQEMGFDISGYGTGKINVNAAGFSDLDLFRAARKLNLMPPPGSLSLEDLGLTDLEYDDPLIVMQSFYAQSRFEEMLDFDEQVVNDVICSVTEG
jgi:hypothetical protein